jgi:hypothetical protein
MMTDNDFNFNENYQVPDFHDANSSHSSTSQNNRKRSLIIKPEPVDGRWSVKRLSKNVVVVMGRDPHNGGIYAFITKSRKTVHLLNETDDDGSMADMKVQKRDRIDYWPDEKTDRKDEVVILAEKEKTDFLKLLCITYLVSNLFS